MPSAATHAVHQVAMYSAETVRQVIRRLPSPARSTVRGVANWLDRRRPPAPIEDWSQPLIAAQRSARTRQDRATGPDLLSGAVRTPDGAGVVEPSRAAGVPVVVTADGLPEVRCLVVTALLDVGGMDEVVAFLARRLPAHGLRTAVLHATEAPSATGEPSGRLGRMLQSSGVDVYEADPDRALDWVKQWKPDVITAHGAPEWVLDIAQQLGVPYVDNLHGMHSHFAVDWTEEAARGAKTSAIISVSELNRQQYLAGNPGFPLDRIVTIPNGVDEERRVVGDRAAIRARLGLTDEYVFLSLARHCQQKNSYGLITAFAELARRRSDVHLVIAGKPDQPRYYRQTVNLRDSLPCRDRIHLRDHAAAPAQLLAAADGFVLNSFFEGWSLASMEALFAGLPVVLSEVCGAGEQIGDDANRGYMVTNPLGDPLVVTWETLAVVQYRSQVNHDELVAAMDRLVTDRERYLLNRGNLAAESSARFSSRLCLERHAAVLRAVADGVNLPDFSG